MWVYVMLDEGAEFSPFLVNGCDEGGRWMLKHDETFALHQQALDRAATLARKYRCPVVDTVPMLKTQFEPRGVRRA